MNSTVDIFFSEEPSFASLRVELSRLQDQGLFADVIILVDSNTEALCLPAVNNVIPDGVKSTSMVVPAGESSKSVSVVSGLIEQLIDVGASRNTLLINLGGGVVSDLGGFVASVFKRGIPFVNIPTTLLAMVDAAVGGKTGINYHNVKNLIGTFCFPEWVYVNTNFLNTLPPEEWRSGLGELFKYALIAPDIVIDEILRLNHQDNTTLLPIIRKALQFKQDLVAIDPYDRHQRHVLNAGHTLGHALESAAVQGGLRITHGEAVAAGIVAEAHLSVLMHDFPSDRLQSVTDLFLNQFAKFLSPLPQPEAVLPFLKHDKKNTSGSITSILFDSDQMPVLTAQIPITLVMQSLQYLYKLVHGSDSTC